MNRAINSEKLESAPRKLKVVEATPYQDAGYPVYLAWYIAGLAGLIFLMASF